MTVIYRKDHLHRAISGGTERDYWLSVDLGQSVDPTAIAVIERMRVPQLRDGTFTPKPIPFATTYRVRHLERMPLRTPYPEIVSHVGRMLVTAPLAGRVRLVIDQTGVGRPVFDMFVAARLKPEGVTITAGDGWSKDGDTYRVAKLLLVSRLQAALHSGLLHIASDLQEADALKSELADFRVSYTATGYSQFSAREGRHDDLVLSVAIGLWHASLDSQKASIGKVFF
jgi:hypothetical protein